ncbi:MAG: hypothetical protein DELT_01090 [Desulfovibrio sp.]
MFEAFWKKIIAKKYGKISYAQSGEDLIVRFLFQSLQIDRPTYLDIGAHDPFYLNNTATLYANGSRGINIEPNKHFLARFQKHRPHDINLNICIGKENGVADYYMMDIPTLNTMSKEEAERLEMTTGRKIVGVIQAPVKTLQTVLHEYSSGVFPDFLTLDVEGFDEFILESIEFEKTYPKVICVETLTYTEQEVPQKKQSILRYLEGKGYFVYADTYINTIFLHKNIWHNSYK